MIQRRNKGALNGWYHGRWYQWVVNGGSEKGFHSRYIYFKVEATGFPDRLNVEMAGMEEKREKSRMSPRFRPKQLELRWGAYWRRSLT